MCFKTVRLTAIRNGLKRTISTSSICRLIGLILVDEQDEQDSPQWYNSSIFRLIGLILLDEQDEQDSPQWYDSGDWVDPVR